MKNVKKKSELLIRGILGGALIAYSALSAIEFTVSNYYFVITLVAVGALTGIILESFTINTYLTLGLSAALLFVGNRINITSLVYITTGVVMYMGCVLSLPEEDAITNALTGSAAITGFLASVLVIV